MDDWLKNKALKSEGLSSRTYVVCDGAAVIGYYCLATGSVRRAQETLPPKLRRNMPDPLPIMVIGRLAVDKPFERRGIGGGMLKDALKRALQVSTTAGCRAVMVHAIDQDASQFYRKYGFIEYPTDSRTMFMPIETVRAAIP